MRYLGFSVVVACVLTGAVSTAAAQNGAVRAIFERYHLLGTFALDCKKPVGSDNYYYVHRLIDPDHAQRDEMRGPDKRQWWVIIDKATAQSPTDVALSGVLNGVVSGKQRNNEPADGVWRVEVDANRFRQWAVNVNGEKLASSGKYAFNGQDTPWLNRCGN